MNYDDTAKSIILQGKDLLTKNQVEQFLLNVIAGQYDKENYSPMVYSRICYMFYNAGVNIFFDNEELSINMFRSSRWRRVDVVIPYDIKTFHLSSLDRSTLKSLIIENPNIKFEDGFGFQFRCEKLDLSNVTNLEEFNLDDSGVKTLIAPKNCKELIEKLKTHNRIEKILYK